MIVKIVTHGRHVQRLAAERGWGNGARYSNLRDIRAHHAIALIDIDWKNYSLKQHLAAVQRVHPFMTVVRDVEDENDFIKIIKDSRVFFEWARYVIVVPKFKKWKAKFDRALTDRHIIGYSVPTRYGRTMLDLARISHPVHLLGGRPDRQRNLAVQGNIVSIDCNRFTLDASFGDYFDGVRYNYERQLSYDACLLRSMAGIDFAWSNYSLSNEAKKLNAEWRRFRIQRTIYRKITNGAASLKTLVQSKFGPIVCPSESGIFE